MKLLFFCLAVISFVRAEAQNKYGIHAIIFSEYELSLAAHPEKQLVDLEKFIPGIVLDIKYATDNNFTHAKVYNLAKAYARKPVAEALLKIQEKLRWHGLGLKIFDAYRPWSATVKFFELMKGDTTYVASPYKGSRHNRGCAVDLTLINLYTGKELPMPSAYDAMVKASWPSTPVADPAIYANRITLITVMQKNGFKVYPTEWWHYDFDGWDKFEVMNIDFEELEKK